MNVVLEPSSYSSSMPPYCCGIEGGLRFLTWCLALTGGGTVVWSVLGGSVGVGDKVSVNLVSGLGPRSHHKGCDY